jgi:hypothetical protein
MIPRYSVFFVVDSFTGVYFTGSEGTPPYSIEENKPHTLSICLANMFVRDYTRTGGKNGTKKAPYRDARF